MRRARLAWALALGLLAPVALGQTPHDDVGNVGDVPSGPAVIRGQVLRVSDSAPVAGADVVLYALSQAGQPGLRRATTDASGRFEFPGISNDPHTAYLLGARYRGIPYPGERVLFGADETERRVEIRVSEPSTDTSRVRVLETAFRVERAGGALAVTETYRVQQPGSVTAYVPPEERTPGKAGLRVELPEGAEDFTMPFGVTPEGVAREGRRVLFYGPFYAGEQEIQFSYRLPVSGETATLRRKLPSGAGAVRVRVPAEGMGVEAPGLAEGEATEIHGRGYRELVGPAVAPGGSVALALQLPPLSHDADAVQLTETRIFIDLDGSAAVVREEHHVEVGGAQPVVADEGGGLLDIPVPSNADAVRFPRETLELGLAAASDEVARLRGPLPPGESLVDLLYRIPVSDDGSAELERRFGKRLPLLSVFVADNGVLVESDRLHRRRPARTSDRTYLHLEAFDVSPDESVAIRVEPLKAPASLPTPVRAAVLGVLAIGVVAFLLAPVGTGAAPAPEAAEEPTEAGTRGEREALYAAIRDLDHDYETGKLSEADYQALRKELRGRAVSLLRSEREEPEGATAPAAAAAACPACGVAGRPGDRFCAQCGARFGGPPEAGAAG